MNMSYKWYNVKDIPTREYMTTYLLSNSKHSSIGLEKIDHRRLLMQAFHSIIHACVLLLLPFQFNVNLRQYGLRYEDKWMHPIMAILVFDNYIIHKYFGNTASQLKYNLSINERATCSILG